MRVSIFYWLKTQWTIEARSHLNRVLRQLDPGASVESDIWVEELPDQDWNQTWAESMRPLRVGPRIIIRPSWEPASLKVQDIEIVLNPKQAFGSGHHATTRMLLNGLKKLFTAVNLFWT